MDLGLIALAAVLLFFLAFANGANDVSKAIATLAGAGLTSVRGAVLWGTVWTVVGALAGLFWGGALIKNIMENIYSTQYDFYLPLSVAVSAAPMAWVALATWWRWPVSTTHAIVGGLVGAGLMAYGIQGIYWSAILSKIALPLLASPFMAIALTWLFASRLQSLAGIIGRTRLCLTPVPKVALLARTDNGQAVPLPVETCVVCHCDSPQAGLTHGLTLSVDHMHWLTSGLLSFSRGLNDTPKLIAVILPFLMLDGHVAPAWLFCWGALAVGAGSWWAGKNITEVLGLKVTKMNHEQGFGANLVATILVIGATRVGLPVSTTHVSASSIMGMGLAHRRGLNMKTVSGMLFAWLVTAPVSGLFAAVIYTGGTL